MKSERANLFLVPPAPPKPGAGRSTEKPPVKQNADRPLRPTDIDRVPFLGGQYSEAKALIEGSLPAVKRLQADFPGRELVLEAAGTGKHHDLDAIERSIRYRPLAKRAELESDLAAVRQLNEKLNALGLRIGATVRPAEPVLVPGRCDTSQPTP
jgi:hypothetical protein